MAAAQPTTFLDYVLAVWDLPLVQAAVIVVVSFSLALFAAAIGGRVALWVVGRTRAALDDALVGILRVPLATTVAVVGTWWAAGLAELDPEVLWLVRAVLATVAVVLWGSAGSRAGRVVLDWLSLHQEKFSVVQPRTLPLLDIALKTMLFGGVVYFMFLAWGIDVTAWLASAGIVGIAVGFAAKDTLANLFAGVFILADAPYKIDDYLILDERTRGRVTEIGLRSTRLLTRDDVEIIVPNSVMANAQVINESGGPHPKERIRCKVQVAYSSDLDKVRRVLMGVATRCELLEQDPPIEPRVRFRSFDDSGISVELMGWIHLPEKRGQALDWLIEQVHMAFRREGIEIPFPQTDVHLARDLPPAAD